MNLFSEQRKLSARKSDPQTSKDAARKYPLTKESQRFRLLAEFVRDAYAGGQGISDEGAAQSAQLARLDAGHKRGSELRSDGLIAPVGIQDGQYGCQVRVCTATKQGIMAYEKIKMEESDEKS